MHLNLAFMEPLSAPFTLPDSAVEERREASRLETTTSWLPDDLDPSVVEQRAEGSRLETTESDTTEFDIELGFETRPPEADAPQPAGPSGVRVSFVPGTVVVAGTGAGPRAEEVARELGAPLLAEVASGAHFGPNLVVAYRELLNAANFGDRISRVIVFGHPTLSREIPQLIQRDGVETVVVRGPAPDDYNPGRRVAAHVDELVVEGEPGERSWAGRWVAASRALIGDEDVAADVTADAGTHAKQELAAVRAPVTRRSLVEAVWRASWPHDRLVLGASRLIRELDRVATGKRIEVHANRGLAGIDGTISTGLGIALRQP